MACTTGTAALRRNIVKSFKLQGLTLQSQAASVLVEVLQPYQDSGDLNEIVDRIVDAVQRQPLTNSLVQRDVCQTHTCTYTYTFIYTHIHRLTLTRSQMKMYAPNTAPCHAPSSFSGGVSSCGGGE